MRKNGSYCEIERWVHHAQLQTSALSYNPKEMRSHSGLQIIIIIINKTNKIIIIKERGVLKTALVRVIVFMNPRVFYQRDHRLNLTAYLMFLFIVLMMIIFTILIAWSIWLDKQFIVSNNQIFHRNQEALLTIPLD